MPVTANPAKTLKDGKDHVPRGSFWRYTVLPRVLPAEFVFGRLIDTCCLAHVSQSGFWGMYAVFSERLIFSYFQVHM